MITRKIRWGVLGWARIAREFIIPAIQRSSNSEFHAIGSRDAAKLAECQKMFGGAKTCASYDEVLRDPEVDAVYIPLPNSMHREWAIKAAEQGKHVLCEKPVALNAAECRDIIAACSSHGVTLMEAFMYRYTHRTRKVLEVLRSRALGDIRFISSTFRYLLTNRGSLYDVGCYPVNFVGMVTDEIAGAGPGMAPLPESVSAELVRIDGVDTIFSGLMKYPSGLIASVNSGFNAQRRLFSEIVGTKGALEIPDTCFDNAGVLTLVTGEDRQGIPVEVSDRYRFEIEDFADAILQRRAPQFTLAETQRNMEVLDRLFAARKD